ncbi:hypothetical protein HDU98_009382 [Podochytrium sp. JEL0797]|nr:hypothetical protein HDU98_009382 [Podochytrium sp. JEL0797]
MLKVLSRIGNESRYGGSGPDSSDDSTDPPGDRVDEPPVSDRDMLLLLKSEYEKLNKLFMQGRKNEAELIKKCKDVTGQMMNNSVKVQAALKLSQNDRSTIASLKKEVKRAWKMVEVAGDKERKTKDAIMHLKIELAKMRHAAGGGDGEILDLDLQDEDEDGDGIDSGLNRMMAIQVEQDQTISNLTKEKYYLSQQNDQLLNKTALQSSELLDIHKHLSTTLSEKQVCEKNLASIKELLAQKKTDEDRNAKTRDKLESTVKVLQDTLAKREHDVSVKSSEIKAVKEVNSRLETMLKEDKAKLDKEVVEKDKAVSKFVKLQAEYDLQHIDVTKLKAENQDQFVDLRSWEEELNKYKEEFKAMVRLKDGLAKRIKLLEEAKMEAEVDRDHLRGQNHQLTYERDTMKKQIESNVKEIESLGRERDIAQKNFVRATGATQKQHNSIKLADQTKRNLEQEISNFKEEAAKMRKIIYSLEKDRDRHINEASKISVELCSKDEDVKIKDIMLYDARKKMDELERKLKEQQTLYENVRADRNLYSKNLIEAQDEINEMKRKLKIMSHQIEQLKEEIGNKEAALAKENLEHAKLDKDKEGLSSTIDKLKQQLSESEQSLANKKADENKLKHIISEADADRVKQKKEYDIIVQERDIIGTQLIRRNDEIALLYEKIKIQASTLNKGEIQYRERLEDIRVLRLEIKKLRREKAILQTETQNVDALKNEIFKLQRDILREKTRVRVLEEELESPMNIHRWRKLSGSDPSTYELITKIQTLQKRLIAKTEEVLEKELVINQKEKLYHEVKEVLQRQPGPEVLEELRAVKDAVKVKMRECKSLASELNMYHSQVNEYKFEIDRLTREMQDLKKKYYEQRKRDREAHLKKQRYAHTNNNTATVHLSPGGVVSENLLGLLGDAGIDVPKIIKIGAMPSIRPNPGFTNKKFNGGGFNLAMFSSGIHHNMGTAGGEDSRPEGHGSESGTTKLPELRA